MRPVADARFQPEEAHRRQASAAIHQSLGVVHQIPAAHRTRCLARPAQFLQERCGSDAWGGVPLDGTVLKPAAETRPRAGDRRSACPAEVPNRRLVLPAAQTSAESTLYTQDEDLSAASPYAAPEAQAAQASRQAERSVQPSLPPSPQEAPRQQVLRVQPRQPPQPPAVQVVLPLLQQQEARESGVQPPLPEPRQQPLEVPQAQAP